MRRWILGLTMVAVLVAGAPVDAGLIYSFTDLGDLLGGEDVSHAMAVNNLGQVVGVSGGADGRRAFLWANGVMTDLGVLTGEHHYSFAWDINDAGDIVGASMPAFTPAGISSSRPFLYSNGSMTVLPGFDGRQGEARGINSAGDVVGRSYVGGAFLYSHADGDVTNLASGVPYSDAYGINDFGQIAGGVNYVGDIDDNRGVRWENGTMTDLGDLPGDPERTLAYDINNLGQVVGESGVSAQLNHAFRWENGVMTDLGVLPGTSFSLAEGINDNGFVVGGSYVGPPGSASAHRAFLWDSVNGIQDLNDMLDSSGAGWTLSGCRDISNAGHIVGWGINPDGAMHGLLLTPVPEPSSLAMLGGLLGWAWSFTFASDETAANVRNRPCRRFTVQGSTVLSLLEGDLVISRHATQLGSRRVGSRFTNATTALSAKLTPLCGRA